MNILVTGTAGYHLAKKLLERGDEVVGLDNYYDVNLKYARLNELGINKENLGSEVLTSPLLKHKWIYLIQMKFINFFKKKSLYDTL